MTFRDKNLNMVVPTSLQHEGQLGGRKGRLESIHSRVKWKNNPFSNSLALRDQAQIRFSDVTSSNGGWKQTCYFTDLAPHSCTHHQSKLISEQDYIILWLVVRTLVEENYSYWEFTENWTKFPWSWKFFSNFVKKKWAT